ncbi:MAG: serine/threonine-protein kinase [Tepidiformaceae bacterium]
MSEHEGLDNLEALLREETRGEYTIERELGRGWGAVYQATEIPSRRRVAIKAFSPDQALGTGMARRFLQGVELAAAFDHPNIIPVFRLGTDGMLLWYAMPYVDGESLAAMLERKGCLSLGETIEILRPVGDALDSAHGHGVIHRNVKPANVMIAADGRVMLTDFELAQECRPSSPSESDSLVGTPYYMSGEQARGKVLTPAADQYSVGVMAYSMLAGQVPFDADSVVDILRKHCSEQPAPLEILRSGLPPHVYAAVDRAMAKEPQDRFPSVGAFVEAMAGG